MKPLLAALKAVAEPTRLRLLVLCAHMDLTVTQLVQILGQSQPRVSRHLKLLSEAGLLERLREGGWVFYRLAKAGPAAELARGLVDAVNHEDPLLALDFERLEIVRQARAKAAADYFARNAARWHEIRSLHVDESEVERALLALLPEEGLGDLLDIGTGTGRIVELVSDRARRVVGIDLSHEMLTLARSNLEQKRLRHCGVQHGDMYQLALPSRSLDCATLHLVLHYAERPADVIAEAARVLRPGGSLVVVDFKSHELDYLREQHAHRWLGFGDEEIHAWLDAAGLQSRAPVHLRGDPLTVGLWLGQRPANDRTANDRAVPAVPAA